MYKKVLLINPFGIGDVLFTTPIIHTLKSNLPAVKIGYLCNRRTVPILENNPYLDYFFIYERDEFKAIGKRSFFAWIRKSITFLNQIKKEGFDVALDFSLNTQYGSFSWLAGIRQRIGYNYKNRGRFLTKKIILQDFSEKHIIEYYTDLLKYLGLELKYNRPELYLKEEDKRKAEAVLFKKNIKEEDILIGIIPGGGKSWGKDAYLKHWPQEKFALLADKIVETYPAKIIIMGDFSEKEMVKEVIGYMQHEAIDLSGSTTLGELAALLARMNLLITNDGGPLHMAVAQGIKTISFFGPVDPRVYGPYPPDENRHLVLRKTLNCSPCYRQFRLSICQKDKECLRSLDVEEAFLAVKRLLG